MIGENSFFADSGFDAEMADPISHEQKTLLERLFISSITPGTYTPMAEVINGTHAAIFVDGKPFMAF